MKIKGRKNDDHKNIFEVKGGPYKVASEEWRDGFRQTLRHRFNINEDTNSLVISESKPYRWFVVRRCKISAIKFAMAGS